jgi:hypothetical protein
VVHLLVEGARAVPHPLQFVRIQTLVPGGGDVCVEQRVGECEGPEGRPVAVVRYPLLRVEGEGWAGGGGSSRGGDPGPLW